MSFLVIIHSPKKTNYERQTDRDRETDRDRYRQTGRDTQTDRDRDRQTETERQRQRQRQTDIERQRQRNKKRQKKENAAALLDTSDFTVHSANGSNQSLHRPSIDQRARASLREAIDRGRWQC